MPYINSDGSVQENRSWFRLSLITDLFWGIANTLALFVQTLIDPKAAVPKGKFVANTQSSRKPISSAASSGRSDGLGRANIKTLPKNCSSGG
mmetsp:Transcript_124441/g.244080  ORF Transcript_124441/g.244080 Transcript_124441/m.244080 type:complete len:92 (+) Transcript_124441:70-345(+)